MTTKPQDRPITLGHLTVERLPPPVLVEHAAKAGFRALGIRFWDGFTNQEVYPVRPGSPMLRETMAQIEATGMDVPEIENIILQPGVDPEIYLPMFETGALLGARRVVVGSIVNDEPLCIAMFARLCELARPFGLDMAIEFYIKWHGCASLEQALRILAGAAQPNGKMLVDALHIDRSGATTAQLAQVPPQLYASLQLCDAPAERPATMDAISFESRYSRLLPGEGDLPLEDILRAYPHDAPLGIEIPMQALEDSIGSQAYLDRCFAATTALVQRAFA